LDDNTTPASGLLNRHVNWHSSQRDTANTCYPARACTRQALGSHLHVHYPKDNERSEVNATASTHLSNRRPGEGISTLRIDVGPHPAAGFLRTRPKARLMGARHIRSTRRGTLFLPPPILTGNSLISCPKHSTEPPSEDGNAALTTKVSLRNGADTQGNFSLLLGGETCVPRPIP
jgi:hypothetical protein